MWRASGAQGRFLNRIEELRYSDHTMKKFGVTILGVLMVALALITPLGSAEKDTIPRGGGRNDEPDLTHYYREAIPEDYRPLNRAALPEAPNANVFIRDAVVSNTNPQLAQTDTFGDSESSIAINPSNPNEIVLTTFSGGWFNNNQAPLWHSLDGGSLWTKQFSVPIPTGRASTTTGCPCDQTVDFSAGNLLSGVFQGSNYTDLFSGSTSNPASAGSWNWLIGSDNRAVGRNQKAVGNPKLFCLVFVSCRLLLATVFSAFRLAPGPWPLQSRLSPSRHSHPEPPPCCRTL